VNDITILEDARPRPSSVTPAYQLSELVRSQLEHAVDGARRGLKVYESLRNLSEVVGTQYGDRVLYELIQNAHDAHQPGDLGEIAIQLVIRSENEGELYVGNKGWGFSFRDVEAIRNLATSHKEIGESIGNKGLGFRSVEALTNDVRIYSQMEAHSSARFSGFCFRFATVPEIQTLLADMELEPDLRDRVAETMPRYLASVPLLDQPSEVLRFAEDGFATVIVLPLRTKQALDLAAGQVQALADDEAPLLLFLDRIESVRIRIDRAAERPLLRVLKRRQEFIADVNILPGCSLWRIDVGDDRRFLLVRSSLEKQRVLSAVEASIGAAPPLKRWRDWKGDAVVSIAVAWDSPTAGESRFYNFLPMGKKPLAPLAGYVDAPFYTGIDRRSAKLDLPLNDMLLSAVAETCAATALSVPQQNLSIPGRVVLDLITWDAGTWRKLDSGLRTLGTNLHQADVFPALPQARGEPRWVSLANLARWPEGRYSAFGPRKIVGCTTAAILPANIGSVREDRLEKLASAVSYRGLAPRPEQLAGWAEAVAKTLAVGTARPRTWAEFYDDLRRVFVAIGADLKFLQGRLLLLDRNGRLRASPTSPKDRNRHVFIRPREEQGRRRRAGAPFPPFSLSRKFHFFDEKVPLSSETALAFEKAGLLRRYDPISALAGVDAALARGANNNQRRDALAWAFKVWCAGADGLEKAFAASNIHVPTRGGWQPARTAAFSSSWTSLGRTLESYLVEGAGVSRDCSLLSGRLLVPFAEWPASGSEDTKSDWRRFLEALGVRDGLWPVSVSRNPKRTPAAYWSPLFRAGSARDGLDADWCALVRHGIFNHPYTDYEVRRPVARIPGQIEYDQLSERARERLCELIVSYLRDTGTFHFNFELGRFDRAQRDWDRHVIPTPLFAFLKHKPWMTALSQEGLVFRRPYDCWSSRAHRPMPPGFVERLPPGLSLEILEHKNLNEIAFDHLELQDWSNARSAPARLADLATAAAGLAWGDRRDFRENYRQALADFLSEGLPLPGDLPIVVSSRGQLEILSGNADDPVEVFVARDPRSFAARVLSERGSKLLETGDDDYDGVISALSATNAFAPVGVEGLNVELLVDGVPFQPSAGDPKLISQGVEWLPDAAVLAHEILGKQLERQIQRSAVDERVRAIRIRTCSSISLVVDGAEARDGAPRVHPEQHREYPTLIVQGALDWRTLVVSAEPLSRLIHGNLRSLETLLSRLNIDRRSEGLDRPTDEEFAEALRCDIDTIREHLSAIRSDIGRLLRMLAPLAAYWAGSSAGARLRLDAERLGPRFDLTVWIEGNLSAAPMSPSAILTACETANDFADLRRSLDLDYARFNACLAELGEPILSNEDDLRRLYEAYLRSLKPAVIDRLRRFYLRGFREGVSLAEYVDLKTFGFLEFDVSWVATRETLDYETIEAHVHTRLNALIGVDESGIELAPYARLVEANRRVLRRAAQAASAVVSVWCSRNDVALPASWQGNDPQPIVRTLEDAGLLDFEATGTERLAELCHRAGCWPQGMPLTVDPAVLGVTDADLRTEAERRAEERFRADAARRTIEFAGNKLDTAALDFIERLRTAAEQSLSADAGWFERSRRIRLRSLKPLKSPAVEEAREVPPRLDDCLQSRSETRWVL
jgi:hypothetical protein